MSILSRLVVSILYQLLNVPPLPNVLLTTTNRQLRGLKVLLCAAGFLIGLGIARWLPTNKARWIATGVIVVISVAAGVRYFLIIADVENHPAEFLALFCTLNLVVGTIIAAIPLHSASAASK
jgi:hypothetical protein